MAGAASQKLGRHDYAAADALRLDRAQLNEPGLENVDYILCSLQWTRPATARTSSAILENFNCSAILENSGKDSSRNCRFIRPTVPSYFQRQT